MFTSWFMLLELCCRVSPAGALVWTVGAGSVGWISITDVEGVESTFETGSVTMLVGATMFLSRRVCSPLLLFDVCCLLLASSRSLLLCLNLDMVLLIFVSGFEILE